MLADNTSRFAITYPVGITPRQDPTHQPDQRHRLIYNLKYKETVEDRVNELLSSRLKDIHNLFDQKPDV